MYKEPSDDDDDLKDSDEETGAIAKRRRAHPEEFAVEAIVSLYEKLLSEREAPDDEDDDGGDDGGADGAGGRSRSNPMGQPSMEYLAKPRGKSYLHCQWVSESDVLADHQV